MKVSVILITYNHSQYIRQTLESILMQQTPHEVEIIIADDCSPDNTVEIIKAYQDSTAFTFTFLNDEKNLGYIRNYQRAFAACSGDYVAIMEGDDYWLNANHLQNHINHLESLPKSSMSFNRHVRLFVEENREEIFDWNANQDYELVTTENLALGNRIGNLSCCVFRGDLIRNIDPKLFDMEIADWMLGMYMGQWGPLLYLKEVTSVYRIHNKGQWSQMDSRSTDIKVIDLIGEYDKYFNYKYTKLFKKHKRRLEIPIYGDNSLSRKIKDMTPALIKKIYRKL
ncbi:MAG: glycosyltransferase [Dysgonomonas sp.]